MSHEKARDEQGEAPKYIDNFKVVLGLCYGKTANVQNYLLILD